MSVYAAIDRATWRVVNVDLEALDERGRAIGSRITFAEGVFAKYDPKVGSLPFGGWWYRAPKGSPEAGPAFAMTTHATRDGVAYGPRHCFTAFSSEELRAAAHEKYLDNARKRAAKRAQGKDR